MLKCPYELFQLLSAKQFPARQTSLFDPGLQLSVCRTALFGPWSSYRIVEEQAWILDPWCRRVTPSIREIQPAQNLDLGRPGPRLYPELLAGIRHRGVFRVLRKRKWVVLGCLVTIFSVVAIASLKMTPGL